jgi:sulfide:quinone oxidoreductase
VNIVLVGGSSGGTLSANLLAKQVRAEIQNGKVQVHLVLGSQQQIFQPGYLHVAFAGQDPTEIVREERSLVNENVWLVEEPADRVDLKSQGVTLASGKTLHYDYVIDARSSVPDPKTIPGLSEAALNFHTSPEESRKIWNVIQQFDGGGTRWLELQRFLTNASRLQTRPLS